MKKLKGLKEGLGNSQLTFTSSIASGWIEIVSQVCSGSSSLWEEKKIKKAAAYIVAGGKYTIGGHTLRSQIKIHPKGLGFSRPRRRRNWLTAELEEVDKITWWE